MVVLFFAGLAFIFLGTAIYLRHKQRLRGLGGADLGLDRVVGWVAGPGRMGRPISRPDPAARDRQSTLLLYTDGDPIEVHHRGAMMDGGLSLPADSLRVGDRVVVDGQWGSMARDECLYRAPARVPVLEAHRFIKGNPGQPRAAWATAAAGLALCALALTTPAFLVELFDDSPRFLNCIEPDNRWWPRELCDASSGHLDWLSSPEENGPRLGCQPDACPPNFLSSTPPRSFPGVVWERGPSPEKNRLVHLDGQAPDPLYDDLPDLHRFVDTSRPPDEDLKRIVNNVIGPRCPYTGSPRY